MEGTCSLSGLKEIVHPKMKIMSSFTNPQVVPNLYEFLCSAKHKGRNFEESFVTRLFWGPIDFHSRKKNTMEVNGAQNWSVSHILWNIFLCVQQNTY